VIDSVRSRRLGLLLGVAMFAAAACSPEPPVAVERSQRSSGELLPDVDAVIPDAGTPAVVPDDDATTELPVVEAPATELAWGSCDDFGAPSVDRLGTRGWECAVLASPMDPFGDVADAGVVELALTRHPATGERRGAILLNPGGPGGAGLPTAWGIRGAMPSEMLRSFDIVSWDPRGVGRSTPSIDCDDEVSPGDDGFIERCAEATGPLSAFLSAPYSVADMEAIRLALGEPELNYLGFSYGSVLGATYADAHPDTVGAFVLDGVTDPLAGSLQGPFSDGFPTLADDGRDAALDRFAQICDATERCLFSLDAATVIGDLAVQVPVLPTPNRSGGPDQVSAEAFDGVIDDALQSASEWELLATGLSDADRGDASTLAAIIARDARFRAEFDSNEASPSGDDSPESSDDPSERDDEPDGQSDFAEANFMIYCADFGPLITEWTFCDGLPVNSQPMSAVQQVDVEREILVIGTTYDPLTPGYHAGEFAAALGDATHVVWDGVGHTAFPGWTTCIDDVVTAQFLRNALPDDGATCSFLFGIDDDERLGDVLFGHGDVESANLLERSLAELGARNDAGCLADVINQATDQVITHVVLDVTSNAAGDALDAAGRVC